MRVGFLGLGRMGAPMARNIARAGHVAGINSIRIIDIDIIDVTTGGR